MNRLTRLIAPLATPLLLMLPALPTHADTAYAGPVTLTANGGFVAPGACQDGPPKYQLVVDEYAVDYYDDWSADITITGPGYYETDFLWDEEGWNFMWFCNAPNRPGTYTVTAYVEIDHWNDYDYWTTYQTVSTTFQVTGPVASAVSYVRKPYGAHGWKFPVKVTRAGRAWPNKQVTLQAKTCGRWEKVLTKRTGSTGRVTFYSTPTRASNSMRICGVRMTRVPFRFYVAGNATTKPSRSTTFRIWRR